MFAGFVASWPEPVATSPSPQSGWGNANSAGDRCDREELFHGPMVAVSATTHHLKTRSKVTD